MRSQPAEPLSTAAVDLSSVLPSAFGGADGHEGDVCVRLRIQEYALAIEGSQGPQYGLYAQAPKLDMDEHSMMLTAPLVRLGTGNLSIMALRQYQGLGQFGTTGVLFFWLLSPIFVRSARPRANLILAWPSCHIMQKNANSNDT